ncbi:MAG: tRNA (guanosine(46)-N7)-methyltransferase TrmB [Chloracidobacterium sp.]|nr:tRNA (guanosine(46)-N7)-methyltransferase TrmB [Chloracidobacterium sp.]
MGRVRVHQHVNPLAPYFRRCPEPIELASVFGDPMRPIFLDLGCARGRFLLQMAQAEPSWNYLGIEIREALVTEANRLAAEAGLTNLHYVFCNAMLWLDKLLQEIPAGLLRTVAIQFPDPWFKKKHAKRRMVNAEMTGAIVRRLAPGGTVFVQTDIEFLADEIFDLFRASGCLAETGIDVNPFPIQTERERAVLEKGLAVYRRSFEKGK